MGLAVGDVWSEAGLVSHVVLFMKARCLQPLFL